MLTKKHLLTIGVLSVMYRNFHFNYGFFRTFDGARNYLILGGRPILYPVR